MLSDHRETKTWAASDEFRNSDKKTGVNFINILRKAFTRAQIPKVQKIQSSRQSFMHFLDLHVQKLL